MAESKDNIVTHGLSGKVGNMLVFTQRNGKTIVSKVPKKSTKEPTALQKDVTTRFQQAVIYAKAAIADATTKQAYRAAADIGESAYNVAVADLLNAPEIDSIDISGYTGAIGTKIIVRATDDYKVVEVKVTIANADGSIVETGNAQLTENGLDWEYIATATNTDLAGDKITIQASDMPGNLTVRNENIA